MLQTDTTDSEHQDFLISQKIRNIDNNLVFPILTMHIKLVRTNVMELVRMNVVKLVCTNINQFLQTNSMTFIQTD